MPRRIPTFRSNQPLKRFVSSTAPERFYQQARWRKLSSICLREEPICRICKKHISQQVDHIIPVAKCEQYGISPFDRNNLRSLCIVCHNKIRKTQ
jgi:5-methylcytosine-specific restriction endonuclease McrA